MWKTETDILTDEELLELGRKTTEQYEGGFIIDGRPMTNIEMFAMHAWKRKLRDEVIARDGCCNPAGPASDGGCRMGGGICPLYRDAEKLIYKHDRSKANDD